MRARVASLLALAALLSAANAAGGSGRADLSLTVSARTSIALGKSISYRVTVTNHGPGSARDVIVRLRTHVPSVAGTTNAVIGAPNGCQENARGGIVRCSRRVLAHGRRLQMKVSITPYHQGWVASRFTVASGSIDPRPGDNAARVRTHVGPGTPPPPPPGTGLGP